MDKDDKNEKEKSQMTLFKGAAFLFGTTACAAVGGFAMMFAKSRKSSPNEFHQGVATDANLESGAKLAARALGRATIYSVTGFSLFCFAVWKLLGVNDMKEFSAKMQSFMPRVSPENAEPEEIDWEEIFKGNNSKKTKVDD